MGRVIFDDKTLDDFAYMSLCKPTEDDLNIDNWSGLDVPCHIKDSVGCKHGGHLDLTLQFSLHQHFQNCTKKIVESCQIGVYLNRLYLTKNNRYFFFGMDSEIDPEFYLDHFGKIHQYIFSWYDNGVYSPQPENFCDFVYTDVSIDWGYFLTYDDYKKQCQNH